MKTIKSDIELKKVWVIVRYHLPMYKNTECVKEVEIDTRTKEQYIKGKPTEAIHKEENIFYSYTDAMCEAHRRDLLIHINYESDQLRGDVSSIQKKIVYLTFSIGLLAGAFLAHLLFLLFF